MMTISSPQYVWTLFVQSFQVTTHGSLAAATTLIDLSASYRLRCVLGTGIVYVGIVGLMVRWLPERRGFAAAGYGPARWPLLSRSAK